MGKGCIDLVVGARPNFIKAAPILRAFRDASVPWTVRLVHTGQHYDEGMSAIFFEQLGIPAPTADLGVGSGTHGEQTARVLVGFEQYLLQTPDRSRGVIVVGDVNSTMAAALAAVKLGIPVAHVVAGLRSFDRSMPEEINRVVTDAVADVLLVSEPSGMENLAREGMSATRTHYVGNVMIDSLVESLDVARALKMAERLDLPSNGYAYVTLHRPSNVDVPEQLDRLVRFLGSVTKRMPVVFPMHPRTRQRLEKQGLMRALTSETGMHLVQAQGYLESLGLMAGSLLAITDSGGVQEETTFLGIPCLTLRPNTERPSTVTQGTNTVVGEDLEKALDCVASILDGRYKRGVPIEGWDGCAAERIQSVLEKTWRLAGHSS
jgi:UDP-N-acetylglucosamine 2-epimerase (non-hydrolysing)